MTSFRPFVWLAFALTLPGRADAQVTSSDQDSGVTEPPTQTELDERVPWHDSLFVWDHSAMASTLGVGEDVQSRNPTYEMSFRLVPRYYLIDSRARNLSVRADVQLIREFTNSDVTTERGEWTFTDTELWMVLHEIVNQNPSTKTDLVLRAPGFRLPTSEASYESGRILGVGIGGGVDQRVPLAGDDAPVFPSTLLRPRVLYVYNFTKTNVPTSDELDRVRISPSGRSLPSDQLSGTAFAEHELNFSLRAETDVVKNLGLVTEVGLRYARKHALAETESICGVVDTGCVEVQTSADAPRWGISTLFSVQLGYDLGKGFGVGAEYTNLSGQLGADGQRQSIVYSPDARFAANLTLTLDVLYEELSGSARSAASAVGTTPKF